MTYRKVQQTLLAVNFPSPLYISSSNYQCDVYQTRGILQIESGVYGASYGDLDGDLRVFGVGVYGVCYGDS